MDVNEVPQEGSSYKDKDKVRKLLYAVDKDGSYTGVNSKGWEAENTATEQAWQAVEDSLRNTLTRVAAGELSPIAYYMEKNLMDVGLLAKYVGKWQWQVKKHCKMAAFRKLSPTMIDKYASVFNISVAALSSFDPQKMAAEG